MPSWWWRWRLDQGTSRLQLGGTYNKNEQWFKWFHVVKHNHGCYIEICRIIWNWFGTIWVAYCMWVPFCGRHLLLPLWSLFKMYQTPCYIYIYINHKYHCLIQDIYWFPITIHIYYQIMPLQQALPKDLRIDSTRWRGPGHRPLEQIQEIEFHWQCSWFSVSAFFFSGWCLYQMSSSWTGSVHSESKSNPSTTQ